MSQVSRWWGSPPAGLPAAGTLRTATAVGRWVLAAAVLGSAMASIDATVVGVALPRIGREFHADVAALQWVTNGYTLTLAGLLLLGGAMGDRYGRRRVFVVGTVWFAGASALCGVSPSVDVLIGARALQGVGAALVMPGSLALLEASFVEEDRGRAIGAWSGLGGVATAIGPFVGGWLIGAASWRWVFFLNVPTAVAVVLSSRHVPESRRADVRGRLDVAGAVLASAGLAGVVFGLTDAPARGWVALPTLVPLAVGSALLGAFLALERGRADPLVPPGLFRSRQFSGTNAVTFLVYGGLGGALFLLPIELQQAAGYGPLAAGTALLPLTVVMLLFSARSGELAARIGPRLQLTVGPVLAGAGLVLLMRVGPGSGYLADVLPGVLVLGAGLAVMVAPLTAGVLAAAPGAYAGVASAVNNAVARAAGLAAVTVLPVAAGVTGDAYLHAERLFAGFRVGMVIAGAACGLGAVVAAATVRNPARAAAPAPLDGGAPSGAPVPDGVPAPAGWHCALDAPPPAPAKR